MFQLNKLLVAVDFSKESILAARFAVSLANQFKAKLYVLHVYTPLPSYLESEVLRSEEIRRQAVEKVKQELHDFMPMKVREQIDVEEILATGEPGSSIVEKAKELDVDSIVIGTHGLSGLAHILIGSVAERVIRHAPCPVLTIRNPKEHLLYSWE